MCIRRLGIPDKETALGESAEETETIKQFCQSREFELCLEFWGASKGSSPGRAYRNVLQFRAVMLAPGLWMGGNQSQTIIECCDENCFGPEIRQQN